MPAPAPPATSRPTWGRCWIRETKIACASYTSCSAGAPSRRSRGPPSASWKRRWPRVEALRGAGHQRHIGHGLREGVPQPGPGPGRQQLGQELPEVREAALIFLYRLLFVLYAEDRGLLPVNDPRYEELRPAEPGAPGDRAQDGRRRRLLGQRHHLLRPPDDSVRAHRQGRRLHRSAALQRRPVRPGGRPAAGPRPPAGCGGRPHRLRPEPRRDCRGTALRQLPRHVRPASWGRSTSASWSGSPSGTTRAG